MRWIGTSSNEMHKKPKFKESYVHADEVVKLRCSPSLEYFRAIDIDWIQHFPVIHVWPQNRTKDFTIRRYNCGTENIAMTMGAKSILFQHMRNSSECNSIHNKLSIMKYSDVDSFGNRNGIVLEKRIDLPRYNMCQ